jgi:hypothetical protein
MQTIRLTFAILAALISLTGCAHISPAVAPAYPYYEHTPSADEMVRAQRAYEAGMHGAAIMHWRNAARWADKFAQYNLGIMYLRGEGVEFDPLRAWAWLELSAERGYPEFERQADELWSMMSEAERRKARAIHERELLPEYGDAARMEAVARKMKRELREATGSRTGSRGFLSMLTVYDGMIPRKGTEYYAPEKWDFQRIVAFETQLMRNENRGRVELGDFRTVEDEEDSEDGAERQPD